MNKETLRKKYTQLRREIARKAQKSINICAQVETLPVWRSAAVVALYASLPEEVDTAPLIAAALTAEKTVCLPKLSGKEMCFYQITADSAYHTGAFGIREPCSDALMDKNDIDLIIVPLLAADSEHYRLGFGGGYYDRYLQSFKGTSIGICFCEQMTTSPLPREAHDIALHYIVCDK